MESRTVTSNDSTDGTLEVIAPPWAPIDVADGAWNRVADGIGSVTTRLRSGLYRVRAFGPLGEVNSIGEVKANAESFVRLDVPFDSPTPFGFGNVSPRYQAGAARELLESARSLPQGLVIFLRDPQNTLELHDSTLRVQSLSGASVAGIRRWVHEPHHGWASLRLAIPPGLYVLVAAGQHDKGTSQAIHVLPGRITVLFAVRNRTFEFSSGRMFSIRPGTDLPSRFQDATSDQIKFDVAQSFCASHAWDLVNRELDGLKNAEGDADPFSVCMLLYARAFVQRQGGTDSNSVDPSGDLLSTLGRFARYLPDLDVIRDMWVDSTLPQARGRDQLTTTGGETTARHMAPNRPMVVAALAIPAFSAGSAAVLDATRRDAAVGASPSYVTDLWERYLIDGTWTCWRGSEPLRWQWPRATLLKAQRAIAHVGPLEVGQLSAVTGQSLAGLREQILLSGSEVGLQMTETKDGLLVARPPASTRKLVVRALTAMLIGLELLIFLAAVVGLVRNV